ncbi:hypothetical protein DO021_03110 [Desulfobacter hydrogenophilus]|uniref:Lipoprotein n=1 Tax=Desulfobacter hydrogenophilus TaxID=2291 RepID=A0A328FJ38_9BACT|nr:hypothetical protein [Desulfobacter hydrogenophilus]NDY71425.1 hypothetical protein [Desulfobacter hydrogenophilus]QBH12165.1 hypothetical protein EYB58_04010 [Desulfobacter hydrogenophilus]RAM03512.1 hypothetical protein DO021_03110 [Desulfobacter hydrogenophilus]
MRFFLIFLVFFFMAVVTSCESEDDSYSGVGKLISDRNKMRYQLSDEKGNTKGKPGSSNQKTDSLSKDASEKVTSKQELSANVLDEKEIVIVEISSGKPLSQGVAYVNKKGDIVKIKLAQ